MPDYVRVPIKKVNSEKWGQLSLFGLNHQICGEKFALKDNSYTFAGQHRVRLYSVRKNVHWKIPEGTQLDIEGVVPATPPRRQPGR